MDKAVQNNFCRNALSSTKFLNRRSVTKDVTNDMNACEDFLQLVIHAVSPDAYTAESPFVPRPTRRSIIHNAIMLTQSGLGTRLCI